MQIEQLVAAMSPEIYENLCKAVETGKWPNGERLTDEQKENSLQAVLLYQAKVQHSSEHMTVGENGEIVQKTKAQLRQELKQKATKQESIANFKNDDL